MCEQPGSNSKQVIKICKHSCHFHHPQESPKIIIVGTMSICVVFFNKFLKRTFSGEFLLNEKKGRLDGKVWKNSETSTGDLIATF
ncbi:unnamed protein product [Caenorhabditis angaria]|uniref:Uncharacterized protein n=1 Tax=Caenorhabditis angaria TaxID=860376 RepID=A0A9P1IQA8_9PELO|nr:unnamed protein product [Caenorhabditis angaria]